MQIIFYHIIEVISLMFTFFYFQKTELVKRKTRKLFQNLSLVIVLIIAIDFLTSYFYKNNYVVDSIKLSDLKLAVNSFFPFTCLHFFNLNYKNCKLLKCVLIGLIINMLLALINVLQNKILLTVICTRVIFATSLFICVFCYVLFIICLLRYANKLQASSYKCAFLVLFACIIVAECVLQIYFPDININSLAIVLEYYMYIIIYSDMYLKIDPITLVLNKRTFEVHKQNINYTTALIVIDVNDFKSINDKYGHLYGDFILKSIGQILLKSYKNVGKIYCIGGDEFCVVLNKDLLFTNATEYYNYDIYEYLNSLISNCNNAIRLESEKYPALKNGIAQGFGVFYSTEDVSDSSNCKTVEECFAIADKRMYEDKKRTKDNNKTEND